MESNNIVAKLNINFYNEKVYLSEVSCSISGDKTVESLFRYFVLYFARIRYNVGKNYGVFRDFENTLRSTVTMMNKTMFTRDDFSSLFNESRAVKPRIICTADFMSDGKLITKFKGPHIEFYATHSVNILLLYIILTLSENDLFKFSSYLDAYLRTIPRY